MWCVHSSLVLPAVFTSEEKGPCFWADQKSGARNHISLWNVTHAELAGAPSPPPPHNADNNGGNKGNPGAVKDGRAKGEGLDIDDFEVVTRPHEEDAVVRLATWVAVEQHKMPSIKAYFLKRRAVEFV